MDEERRGRDTAERKEEQAEEEKAGAAHKVEK